MRGGLRHTALAAHSSFIMCTCGHHQRPYGSFFIASWCSPWLVLWQYQHSALISHSMCGYSSSQATSSQSYMRIWFCSSVSVEPSGGLSVGEEVRLTCTVSEVYETFQLTWLKDYSRTMLISKQETLTPSGAVRSLTLVIPSIQTHHQKWACAVFQGNIPRAFLPLRLEAKGIEACIRVECVFMLQISC